MEKEVIITISGAQDYDGQDPDGVEFITSGTFCEKPDGCELTYQESELTGMGSTTTTVKIEENRVSVARCGDTRTLMIFEEGQKHLSYYDMGFGAFTVGISAHRIMRDFKEREGVLAVTYFMEINNTLAGENSFCLRFRDAAPKY